MTSKVQSPGCDCCSHPAASFDAQHQTTNS